MILILNVDDLEYELVSFSFHKPKRSQYNSVVDTFFSTYWINMKNIRNCDIEFFKLFSDMMDFKNRNYILNMLHLKFALNLENLADEMIKAISAKWTNPFEAPVVIFPDPKLEQWFRLRWMKKKGVLANLNKSTIDRFLFDILVGKDDSQKKLSAEMLTNVILA